MNLISYLILAVLIVCFVLAVRYTRKHGSCETCGGNCAGCGGCRSAAGCQVQQQKPQVKKTEMKS